MAKARSWRGGCRRPMAGGSSRGGSMLGSPRRELLLLGPVRGLRLCKLFPRKQHKDYLVQKRAREKEKEREKVKKDVARVRVCYLLPSVFAGEISSESMEGGAGSTGAGAGGGITSTINLGRGPGGAPPPDLTGQVHLLPCCVKHDGPCPVSHYFKPKNTGVVSDGMTVEEAFFRGRKLQGATTPLPDGYCGYVLSKEGNLGNAEDSEWDPCRWVSRAEFQSMTYWNHDSVPCQDDPLIRCFHWLSVANALHKPVTTVDLASTAVAQKKV